MSLMRSLHMALVGNPVTRRYQRRLTRWMKRTVGCPDAYGDLFSIARVTNAKAVLDIGSYLGDTIVRFRDELDLPVYGFEPTPDTFLALSRRFAANTAVEIFNCALADRDGRLRLFCNKNAQTNSLLDNDTGNISAFPDETRHVGEHDVEVRTLDAWSDQHLPDGGLIVKADVQGAEGMLLDGGTCTFRERVIAFYSEAQLMEMYVGQTTFSSLHERLTSEFGFRLHNMYPCLQDALGRATQLDALWVKEDFLQEITA